MKFPPVPVATRAGRTTAVGARDARLRRRSWGITYRDPKTLSRSDSWGAVSSSRFNPLPETHK